MKVYIQSYPDGMPHNHNFASAWYGFQEMGWETVAFSDYAQIQDSRPEDVIVGYVGIVQHRLKDLGHVYPDLDYPEELQAFLGRKIWASTLNAVSCAPETWPVFVKSRLDKAFTGTVVQSPADLVGGGLQGGDLEAWCSEVVDFVSEWRVYVRYGRILDMKRYRGDWRLMPDPAVVEQAVREYAEGPAGYAADFGVTADGRTLLIEINDGYALGNYGLQDILYAKLLSARWAELTETEDECDFDRVYR